MHLKTAALVACCIAPFILPAFGPAIEGPLVCGLAAAGVVVGAVVFRTLCRPDRASQGWAACAFVFTSVFGTAALLQFADLAMAMSDQEVPWQHAPLLLVKALGAAYHRALTPDLGSSGMTALWHSLCSTVASVGVCEEAVKLLPVAVAIGTGHVARRRGAMFIGGLSGLGFGVTEGLWISFQSYLHDAVPLSLYLTRLVGCSAAHGAITLLAASLLVSSKPAHDKALAPGRWRFLCVLPFCLLAAAIVHGAYDTFLSHALPRLAGLTMALVVWAIVAVEEHTPVEPA
jgi:RsiW-degrading membrane proteinase PrsW (M82 family)